MYTPQLTHTKTPDRIQLDPVRLIIKHAGRTARARCMRRQGLLSSELWLYGMEPTPYLIKESVCLTTATH